MAKKDERRMTDVYRYDGRGRGVPGLPHIVSYEQAKGLGVLLLLEAAILNGSYRKLTGSTLRPAGISPQGVEGFETADSVAEKNAERRDLTAEGALHPAGATPEKGHTHLKD